MGAGVGARGGEGFSATGKSFFQQKLLQELRITVDLRPPGLVNTPLVKLESLKTLLWLLLPGCFDLPFFSFDRPFLCSWSSRFSPFLPPAATTASQTAVEVRACCVWRIY